MGFLIFKCNECKNVLILSDNQIGKDSLCPSCHKVVPANIPSIYFPCPWCECDLYAPDNLRSESLLCPNCENNIRIPECPRILCRRCRTYIEIEYDHYKEIEGRYIVCPSCSSHVEVKIFISRFTPFYSALNTIPSAGLAQKTLRIDEILDGIPQGQSIEQKHCPYCKSELKQIGEKAYVCRYCQRVLTFVKRRPLRRMPPLN